MGGLKTALEMRLAGTELAEQLRAATTVILNYTSRLRQDKDQWRVELICDGQIQAYAPAMPCQNLDWANTCLRIEAKGLKGLLRDRINGFHAEFRGYYFYGNQKLQKDYGLLC